MKEKTAQHSLSDSGESLFTIQLTPEVDSVHVIQEEDLKLIFKSTPEQRVMYSS